MEGQSSNGLDGPSSSDIGRFMSLTNVPEQQAAFFLEATNGNFDRAIEMFYGRRSSHQLVLLLRHRFNIQPRTSQQPCHESFQN